MQRQFVCLSVLLLLIGCALPIYSQQSASEIVSVVKFTGTLTGSTGKPLRGIVGVNFYLYAEKEGGAPLWMETQNVHLDKSGHYSVMLGSATPHGMPAEVFAGDGARWLSVEASGQPQQPRTLLFSLPYGGPAAASAVVTQSQDLGPQGLQKLPPSVHGNGVANFIPVWTAKNIISESVLSQSGNNIGVGTTTPATILDVFSGIAGVHAPIAQFGSKGTTDSNSLLTYNGTGTTEMFQSGCANCFVPGAQAGDGGVRVTPGKNLFLGDSGNPRLKLDSVGNAEQPRTASGMVKAMIFYDGIGGSTIISCFNSTLSGAAATTPPCGFTSDKTGTGDYILDLGFRVDDRFFSLTELASPVIGQADSMSVCTDVGFCTHSLTANQIDLTVKQGGKFMDDLLYLIVY